MTDTPLQIKFSHMQYCKFPNELCMLLENGLKPKVRLLEALEINKEELSESFIDFDTAYLTGPDLTDIEHYKLPEGKLILLLFGSAMDNVFPTLRRWTPEKWAYYRKNVGKLFRVVVSE